ncbi:MAG TPA: hypothetical protein DCL49_14185 [Candidatus Omnitrophica bacterium]|nr:hypothetical protein [Candidatus Omnitrophota bacterium]HBG62709.1 hypothetical protein [Candidatus Omnitrophota bacterium]HCD39035.1 hypothetical protein [Candidatus Omnitrophota bacterium]
MSDIGRCFPRLSLRLFQGFRIYGITATFFWGQPMRKNNLTERVIIVVSSVFYIGCSPFLAGTMASLAAFLVDILIIKANVILHLGIVGCITFIGFLVSGRAEKVFGQKDAREIVIDDFNGVLVGLLFLPYSLKISILGFIIFRIMDGLKPYPIYKMEKLKGSWGVMGDDLVAGVYTNIVLQLLRALLAWR